MQSVRPKRFIRSAVVVLFSALCLALGIATTSLAAGTPGRAHLAHGSPPDGMSWRDYRLMMAQMPLDAAATKIQALAAKPGPAHAGFFETAVDDSRRILTVYWHGPVPANVQHLISRLRAHVDIRVVQTRYSLATLNRDVLVAIHTDRSVVAGYPMSDGSGIQLNVDSPISRSVPATASAMRSRFGVPVAVSRTGPVQLQYCAVPGSNANLDPGSRCNDLEPFWGGDVIQNSYGYGCTGGFGVHDAAGGEYLLTAAHCAYNGSGYANGVDFYNGQDPSNWSYVGQITDVPGPDDVAVIPTGSGNQYYDGPGIFAGDTYNTKIVAGQRATSKWDSLCESGAYGGVQCGFDVLNLNVSERDPDVPGQVWTGLAEARNQNGNHTIRGDSGGPWFSLDGCCTYVWAQGITNGDQPDGYGGWYDYFTPITTATNDIGVTVNTG